MHTKNIGSKLNIATLRYYVWDFEWLKLWFFGVRGKSIRLTKALVSSLLTVILIIFMLAVLLILDIAFSWQISSGITIGEMPVGGMSKNAAAALLDREVVQPARAPITLYYGEREFQLEPESIGLWFQVDKMVDEAYWKGQGQPVPVRIFRRLFVMPLEADIPVSYELDGDKLAQRVSDIAGQINYPATNASIEITSSGPEISASAEGLKVNEEATIGAVLEAIPTDERRVPVITEPVAPEITEDVVHHVIVVDISARTLYLYDREEYVGEYVVAVGSDKYPTPPGKYHIYHKEKDPVWLPTSDWAEEQKGIPVEPGPDNPLGKYWMDLGGGIGIHATPYEQSLGEAVSHGCIRMATWAAEELYNTVELGTPVFIVE